MEVFASRENKENPLYPEKTVTVAFLRERFQCLLRDVQSKELSTQHDALKVLFDELKSEPCIAEACEFGAVDVLTKMLYNEDNKIRLYSVKALRRISFSGAGRTQLVEKTLENISHLLEDEQAIRLEAYKLLINVTEIMSAVVVLVDLGFTDKITEKLPSEKGEALALTCQVLLGLLKIGEVSYKQAIKLDGIQHAIEVMKTPLENEISRKVVMYGCRILQVLTTEEDGKLLALKTGAIPLLIQLAQCHERPIQSAATAALMMMTIVNDCKVAFIEYKGVDMVINMIVEEEHVPLIINLLKIISNITAHQDVRPKLNNPSVLSRLRELERHNMSVVSNNAIIAIELILWKA
eukprot:TRINITY_DN781932_c0_g1_i1.p1 TRINITY_DN781932_c0_g1~~TRINITY_DN781932_c0_g1_i1.p1  ORF type:complete len:351 (+),score=76.36 TRINITY_DN781932_c0_g1_i1:58-1110(+)